MSSDEAELVQRLTLALTETEDLIRTHVGSGGWAKQVGEFRRAIQNHDPSGLVQLRGAFGTMGALNDLYICPENGHRISRGGVEAVNQRLQQLVGSF